MELDKKLKEATLLIEKATAANCDGWQISRFIPNLNVLFLCGFDEPFRLKSFLAFGGVRFIDLPKTLIRPEFTFEAKDLILTFHLNSESVQGIVKCEGAFFILKKM